LRCRRIEEEVRCFARQAQGRQAAGKAGRQAGNRQCRRSGRRGNSSGIRGVAAVKRQAEI